MLIPAFLVEYVAIRTVRQSRAFVPDRFTKHIEHRGVNPRPLIPGQSIAAFLGMDSGNVEQFGCVKIANARNRPLIEQGNFDGPPAVAKSRV